MPASRLARRYACSRRLKTSKRRHENDKNTLYNGVALARTMLRVQCFSSVAISYSAYPKAYKPEHCICRLQNMARDALRDARPKYGYMGLLTGRETRQRCAQSDAVTLQSDMTRRDSLLRSAKATRINERRYDSSSERSGNDRAKACSNAMRQDALSAMVCGPFDMML